MRKLLALLTCLMLLCAGAGAESSLFGLTSQTPEPKTAESSFFSLTLQTPEPKTAESSLFGLTSQTPEPKTAESSFFSLTLRTPEPKAAEPVETAAPAAGFTFRDGITWNTTLAELQALFPQHDLHENDLLGEDELLGYKAAVSLMVREAAIGSLQSDYLLFGLVDGKLVLMIYENIAMSDDAAERLAADNIHDLMKKSLAAKYGEVTFETYDAMLAVLPQDGYVQENLEEPVEGTAFAAWLLPDQTLIYLADEQLTYLNYLAMDEQAAQLISRMKNTLESQQQELTQDILNAI